MKKIILLTLLTSFSAFAIDCEVGKAKKIINFSDSGHSVTRADGYAYIISYDKDEEQLTLIIEGGKNSLNTTNETFGAKKAFLSLGKKGEASEIIISCE
jgi:hypothetical protein